MLISLNWLKKYVKIPVSDDELIKLIGSRLVEVEDVIDNTHKYDKVYAVLVKAAEKIPDTHLTLCKVDDAGRAEGLKRDDDGLIQVLCGAPNVRVGMFAAWIAPGAIVPATFHDPAPFKIGVRKMLGRYDSYGMLAGADELDFGDDHTGIVSLDPATTKAGDALADLFDLRDLILDIENKSLTHRPDTFGILGFAREVAGITGQVFETPAWYDDQLFPGSASDASLTPELSFTPDPALTPTIELTDPALCPRYTALVFATHGETKAKYLTLRDTLLARSGMRPLDPIVDATNYLMLLTGQPLHAFDYDKFIAAGGKNSAKIRVRAARAGEELTLLDGKTLQLIPEDIVICSHDTPVALAGAMGGQNTLIDASTKRIILESATFSLFNLRKTQMAHGIFSEAITRFTKGQPAGQTLPVAFAFARDLYSSLRPVAFADAGSTRENATISLSPTSINQLLGTTLTAKDVISTLSCVGIAAAHDKDQLICHVPFWRTDLHIPEDLIEEVGRLRGFDNIAPVLPLHTTADKNPLLSLKSRLRAHLAARGANEVLTYSFVPSKLLSRVGQKPENSYRIVNSISPDLQYIRQSLLPSLLDKVYQNLRAGHNQFAFFEMNQVYPKNAGFDSDGVPVPRQKLAFLVLAPENTTAYYLAKKYLEGLFESLGLHPVLKPFLAAKDHTNAYFEPLRSASVFIEKDGQTVALGDLGEFRQPILVSQKLPARLAALELDLEALLSLATFKIPDLRLSQYPAVSRDLTLAAPLSASFISAKSALLDLLARSGLVFTLTPISIFHPAGSTEKHLSFHLQFAHPDHTLTPAEIQTLMHKLEKVKLN